MSFFGQIIILLHSKRTYKYLLIFYLSFYLLSSLPIAFKLSVVVSIVRVHFFFCYGLCLSNHANHSIFSVFFFYKRLTLLAIMTSNWLLPFFCILMLFATVYAKGVCDNGQVLCCHSFEGTEGDNCIPISVISVGGGRTCTSGPLCCRSCNPRSDTATGCKITQIS